MLSPLNRLDNLYSHLYLIRVLYDERNHFGDYWYYHWY